MSEVDCCYRWKADRWQAGRWHASLDRTWTRTALNGASGRLARANRIPNSHTATDYDSHASATCSYACRLPGSYDLGEARKLRHSPPDLLPPLTISVRYILRRRQRQFDYPQPANPPTNQSHRNDTLTLTLTLTLTNPTARAHLSHSSVPLPSTPASVYPQKESAQTSIGVDPFPLSS